jgi:hypothetical protein
MRKSFVFILSITMIVAFSGCATLSKNECLEADWFEIGRRDGVMGKPRALFQQHRDACLKHGVNPNRDAYYEGRDEGLKFYCTEDNGFKQGRLGRTYQYVCTPELEPDFLAGYVEGRKVHEYELKIASLKKRLESIDSEIKKKEYKLYSSKLRDEQRAKIRSEIRSLDIEYRDIIRELKYLERTGPT